MRAQVHKDRRAVGIGDFQRERVARLRAIVPRPGRCGWASSSDAMRGGNADHQLRGLQPGGGLDHGVEGIDGGDHQQLDALALLFRHGDHVGEQLLFVAGEELIVAKLVFGGAGGELAHGHHDDVVAAHVGFLENLLQMPQAAVIAHGHQHAAGPGVQSVRQSISG